MPILRRIEGTNSARFITFSCFHRYQLLTNPDHILIFLDEVNRTKQLRNCRIYGYVIMPEHVHLVLHPTGSVAIGALVGEFKSRSAKRIFQHMSDKGKTVPEKLIVPNRGVKRKVFWQARFYDHNCRSEVSVRQKIEYCHKNPVTRGLVDHPVKWRWSSYNWYEGKRDSPLKIDEFAVVG